MDASPDDPLIETARRLVRGIRVTEVDGRRAARIAVERRGPLPEASAE